MTILVAGATGTVGSSIVEQLTEAGHPVRALTRDPARASAPEGARLVQGDLTDPETLAPHLEGVTGLHLITFGGDDFAELTTAPRIAELAVASGVRRITVLCGYDSGPVEAALKASGLDWTLLQPVEFMANALEWAPSARDEGVVREAKNFPSAAVHEADIAAVAVAALTEEGHGGRAYPLSGPEALTHERRVQILAEAAGRDIRWVRLTPEEEAEHMRAMGYDEEYVGFAILLATEPPEIAGRVQDTVEKVTGRPARTFAQWAQANADAFRP